MIFISLLFIDLDECADSSHGCDVNASCTNTHGSYNCTCKPTYTGDGKSYIQIIDHGEFNYNDKKKKKKISHLR